MSFDACNDLMTKLGPMVDALQISALPGQKAWLLGLTENLVLDASLHEERGVLAFTADIGKAAANLDVLNRRALSYSATWHSNGGYWIGVDPRSGNLLLMTDYSVSVLTLPKLVELVADMAVCVEGWRAILRSDSSKERDALSIGAFDMMRV